MYQSEEDRKEFIDIMSSSRDVSLVGSPELHAAKKKVEDLANACDQCKILIGKVACKLPQISRRLGKKARLTYIHDRVLYTHQQKHDRLWYRREGAVLAKKPDPISCYETWLDEKINKRVSLAKIKLREDSPFHPPAPVFTLPPPPPFDPDGFKRMEGQAAAFGQEIYDLNKATFKRLVKKHDKAMDKKKSKKRQEDRDAKDFFHEDGGDFTRGHWNGDGSTSFL